jgi:hypothetical protein
MAPPGLKVSPHLAKWWKSHVHVNGMRTQVQSPYRKDHITSFVHHIPESAKKKVTENGLTVGDICVAIFNIRLICFDIIKCPYSDY